MLVPNDADPALTFVMGIIFGAVVARVFQLVLKLMKRYREGRDKDA